MRKCFFMLLGATLISAGMEAQTHRGPLHVPLAVGTSNAVQGLSTRAFANAVDNADRKLFQGREFYAVVTNSDDWSGASIANVPYGVYSFIMGLNKTYKAVSTNLNYNFMASAFSRDHLIGVQALDVMGALSGARYQSLDSAQFKPLWQKIKDGKYETIPNAMAYDPTSDKVYAAMYNSDISGLNWAVFNEGTRSFDIIHKWNNKFQPAAIAARNDGQLFCVGLDGKFYSIDKTTGDATTIGSTGVAPAKYVQGMGYDARTGLFIWHAVESDGSKLYAVDPETGKASLITSLTRNEQVSTLFFKDNKAPDKAPAAVSDLAFNYSAAGSTSGNITFTVPATAYDGSTLSSDIDEYVYIDGKLQGDGSTVKPGDKQTFAFDLTNDNHYVDVVLSNDAGLAPVSCRYEFVGCDTPKAVTDVALAEKDGVATVTWKAPSGGVNNGYIDPAKFYYEVVRMPDSLTVGNNLRTLSFTETMPKKMERYSYRIIPYNGSDKRGGYAESNAVLYGDAFTAPYKDDFNDASTKSLWTVCDGNADKNLWHYDSYNKAWALNTGSYNQKNSDDWLISPAISMKKGEYYAFTANIRNTFAGYKEDVRMLYGTNPADTSTFKELSADSVFDTDGKYVDKENDFTVDADGNYYVAIRSKNSGSQKSSGIFVKSVAVDAIGKAGAPAAATDLTVTPDAGGEQKVTIACTAPTKSLDGKPVSGTLKASVYRDDAAVAVVTKDGIKPGEKVSVEDAAVPTVARHSYSVAFANASGEGKKASASAFVGVYGDGYSTHFDNSSDADQYVSQGVVGNAEDHIKWGWQSWLKNLSFYAMMTKGQSFWLYFPAFKLDADAVYDLSFKWTHNIYGDKGGADASAWIGDKADSLSQKKLCDLPYTSYSGENESVEIITGAAGIYYPAINIKGTSANGVFPSPSIDDVALKKVASAKAPGKVEDLTVKAADKGGKQVTVAFAAPAKDYAGRKLTGVVDIKVFRSANTAIPLKTYTGQTSGAKLSFTDDEPRSGMNRYTVITYNSYGTGRAAEDSAYVGIDIPAAVEGLTVNADASDMKATLSWNAPQKGIHGGYIGDVKYQVYEVNPNAKNDSDKMKLLATTTDRTYTYAATGDSQALYYLGVMPASDAGAEQITLRSIVLGKPYELPFKESFANGKETTQVWLANTSDVYYNWAEAQDNDAYKSEDGDNGFATFNYTGYTSATAVLTTPKFKAVKGAKLTFWTYQGLSSSNIVKPTIAVAMSVNDGEAKTILEPVVVTAGTAGWKQYTVNLPYADGDSYATISFIADAHGENNTDMVLLDNVSVEGPSATGIASLLVGQQGVHGTKGGLTVMGLAGVQVTVYTLSGVAIDHFTATGNDVRNLQKGSYIVRAGKKAVKIVVR